jgi:hypothetical protein
VTEFVYFQGGTVSVPCHFTPGYRIEKFLSDGTEAVPPIVIGLCAALEHLQLS